MEDGIESYLKEYFDEAVSQNNFSNGRYVRNLFEKVLMVHSKRVVKLEEMEEEIDFINVEDIKSAVELLKNVKK